MPRIQPNCLDYLPKFDKVKSITILEPIGPEYSVADVPNGQVQNTIDSNNHITGKMQTTPFADPQSQTVLSGLNLVTQQADGQYHVGNAEDGNLQLYRIYSGQVILCTPDRAIAYEHRTREKIEYSLKLQLAPSKLPSGGGAQPGPAAANTPQGGPKPAGTPSPSGGGGAQANVNAVIQANRISAIFNDSEEPCRLDQIVLSRRTESDYSYETEKFAHVEWRSTADLFDYLGAIARYEREFSFSNDLTFPLESIRKHS